MTPLHARARIVRGIREFFWSRGFLEVETPVLLAHPSQEPELEPMCATVHDHRGNGFDGFLRMSPEFSIKKLLGSDALDPALPGVFEIGPVFRDGEPWGGRHNPEFTMLEWYRPGATYVDLMDDCEALIHSLSAPALSPISRHCESAKQSHPQQSIVSCAVASSRTPRNDGGEKWERLTMREAWQCYTGLNLDTLLTREAMAAACLARGLTVSTDDTFDDCFFKIHLTDVEPKLGQDRPTFLYDWPVQLASLARRKPEDPRYAERVELYANGLELANGFTELTDSAEQRARFLEDQAHRARAGRPVYPLDEAFLAALDHMPPTAGIALGVDRLVMLLTGASTIGGVRLLPAEELWGEHE